MLDKKEEQEYNIIKKRRENISKEIVELKQNEIIQKYLSLMNEDKHLLVEERELYQSIKYGEYKSCHHLGIRTLIDRDYIEGRVVEYLGCIKCGLDESILAKVTESNGELKNFSFEDQVMYNYLVYNSSLNEINLNSHMISNLDLARSIYSKIIENNPEIDDMTALKYFEIALQNMETKDTHESRKKSRVKRLNLNNNFSAF